MRSKSRHWLFVAITSLTIGSGVAFAEKFTGDALDSFLPDSSMVSRFRRPGSIIFLSSNEKVIQKLGPTSREKVIAGEMPPLITKAFIAAEDRRFYKHKGVDMWGISRALINNFQKRRVIQGGSTITQQLARTVFLSQDRTLTRKLKEAALAYKLERQLSKQEIIEQYLNNVYLGSGAYGIADAAWIYFTKPPQLLNLQEIALIAGLPPAPSFYSPLVNPDLSLKRRTIVLNKMFNEGFISKKQFSSALNSPLNLKPAKPKYFNSSAPFFTSWASQQLPLLLTPEQLEVGGLKIRTSLNLDWQVKAKEVIKKQASGNLEGAIVSIQPNSGLVRVLVGGKDFGSTQFNRATQALRSPGSTFKIFPFTAALNSGIKPEDVFNDRPKCWNGYCPKNFGNKYLGKVSLSDAFKNSSNIVAVQLLEKIGFDSVISIATDLGIGEDRFLGKYLPLAIGAYEQTVLEMTAAYAALANRGNYKEPTPFEEIRGPGDILLWRHDLHHKKASTVLKPEIADTMNWMLQEVVNSGTGKLAALKRRPVAGKTGTSESGRDLWFIGSIPQLTTGIWFGYDNNQETKRGSGEAAWAWHNFMSKIEDDFQIKYFPEKPKT